MSRPRGFTLVEALIALVILAIVSLLAYRGMNALTSGEARLSAESQRWVTLDRFFTRIEGDLRAAVPRAVRHGSAQEPAFAASVDDRGNASLTFSRAGSEFVADPGVAGQRIGYAQDADRIVVDYWPALDNVASAAPTRYTLLAGVAQFHAGYATRDGRWIAQWPVLAEPDVPRAVRVDVAFTDGTTVSRWITLQ
ncbi:MAG: type II secretion system minor pseudopilin GspJ [Proteobacteria bacterium]|nr:type II secretion system minor pseudopilin GspJ [Pseudomonadota bacterium]